jgi:hypothetical protein
MPLRLQGPWPPEAPAQVLIHLLVVGDPFPLVVPRDAVSAAKGDIGKQTELGQMMTIPDVAGSVEIPALDGVEELPDMAW